MGYDYKENLKAFIEKNDMTLRIAQLVAEALRYDYNVNTVGMVDLDELLPLYLQKKHSVIDCDEFFDFLCDWSDQQEYVENPRFWSDLHQEWQRIAAKKIVLITPTYKSIW